jgi:radical SAM superfamily enzyme
VRYRTGLQERFPNSKLRFHGQESYIRCIAHVLNRIVKKILESLKAGDLASANDAIELVSKRQYIEIEDSVLAQLRVLIIWISRSPKRKSQWRDIYK